MGASTEDKSLESSKNLKSTHSDEIRNIIVDTQKKSTTASKNPNIKDKKVYLQKPFRSSYSNAVQSFK